MAILIIVLNCGEYSFRYGACQGLVNYRTTKRALVTGGTFLQRFYSWAVSQIEDDAKK